MMIMANSNKQVGSKDGDRSGNNVQPHNSSLAHPLCVRSSTVLWQIHGVNERPQRAGDVGFSTWKLDKKHGVLQLLVCGVPVQMKLDRRPITEDH